MMLTNSSPRRFMSLIPCNGLVDQGEEPADFFLRRPSVGEADMEVAEPVTIRMSRDDGEIFLIWSEGVEGAGVGPRRLGGCTGEASSRSQRRAFRW
jgi:hypothetical protein